MLRHLTQSEIWLLCLYNASCHMLFLYSAALAYIKCYITRCICKHAHTRTHIHTHMIIKIYK
jgi:hypothetical protein